MNASLSSLVVVLLWALPHTVLGQDQRQGTRTDTTVVHTTAGTALFFDLTPDGRSIVVDLLGQLWAIPVAGGTAHAISDAVAAGADDRQPSISPDGQWIATRSDRPAGRGIWLHPYQGGVARQLTDSAVILGGDVGVPTWSPGGKQLAYSQNGRIVLLDVATSQREQLQLTGLERANLDEPSWSPDGQHLLVTGPWTGGSARALLDGPPGASIQEVDLANQRARRITPAGVMARAPAYSPDGKRLAYFVADSSGSFRLVVQELAGSPLDISTEPGIEPRRVRWGRDGASLVFVAQGRLRRVPATGGASEEIPLEAELRVPRTRYAKRTPSLPAPGRSVEAQGFTGLALAPDGRTIGILALGKLWLVDPRGRTRAVASTSTSARGLTWSPDGSRVAWSGGPLPAQDIWITDVQTGVSRQVTRSAGSDSRAAWSPDGRWIAYMHNSGKIHLVNMSATASDSSEIVGPEMPYGEYAAFAETMQWTPAGDTLLIYGMDGWPVANRECVTAKLVPLKGDARDIDRFPCRPSHVTLAGDGSLIAIENGVITERTRTPDGWADPHRVGDEAALYPSVSRDGSLLFVAGDGLRLRNRTGQELRLGWPIRFSVPSSAPLLVRNVRLVDPDAPADTAPRDVRLANDRIVEIGQPGRRLRVPREEEVLDAEGRWMIPGLIDTHSHFYNVGLAMPRAALYHGVTTVREMWGPLADAAALRDDLAAGVAQGARMVVSGPPFYPSPTGRSVTSDFLWIPVDSTTTDRGLQMLRAFGAGHVKVRYAQTWSGAAAFLRRAHAFGLPGGGHCAHALATVAAGIDTHEHADGQCGDWEFGIQEDITQLYRAAGIVVVPVIDLHDESVRSMRDTLRLYAPDVFPFRTGLGVPSSANPLMLRRLERRAVRARTSTNQLYRGGVRFAVGTDAESFPGQMPRELEALVAAGFSPADALRAATSQAAMVLGLDREIGRLAPGYRADLVLLEANPLNDIGNAHRIWALIQGGRIIDRAALLEPSEVRF